MERLETYSIDELQGIAAMLSDMLKDRTVFLQQMEDVKRSDPWLAPALLALENQDNYINMIERGGGKARFAGTIIEINLPDACVTDGSWEFWGDDIPLEFHFEKLGDEFRFSKCMSNKERAAFRCQTN